MAGAENVTSVTLQTIDPIWVPDLYYRNSISSEVSQEAVFIDPQGGMMVSQRVTKKLACHMHLGKYPFDAHTCKLELLSYSEATDDCISRCSCCGTLETPCKI